MGKNQALSRRNTAWLRLLIRIYQWTVSPFLPNCCRFYPSCSQYAIDALTQYGLLKGLWRAGLRLLRCHPWSEGGYDPVCCSKRTCEKRDMLC